MRRMVLAATAIVAMAVTTGAPVRAQALSPEADLAFWCAGLYTSFILKGVFTSPEHQQAAMTELSRFEPVMAAEAARLGWQQADVEATARSYGDEVTPQVDDYLLWGDATALRYAVADCFPTVAF